MSWAREKMDNGRIIIKGKPENPLSEIIRKKKVFKFPRPTVVRKPKKVKENDFL